MSFGKDNAHLANIPRYGGSVAQRAANAGRRKKQPTGGSKRAYWSDNFVPDEFTPSTIRIIPGDYQLQRVSEKGELYTEQAPWWECKEHFHGSLRRGAICSAGPRFMDRKLREVCYGCDIFWEGKDGGGKRKISMSDKFVFAVIDQGLFHKVPQVDHKTGQYQMNEKTGQPYTEWVKCTGTGCLGCPQAQETKEGNIRPWMLNKAHFNALNGYARGIGTCCVTCSGRGTIKTEMWQCSNPACGDLIFDMSSTTATQEQINTVTNDLYRCPSCSHVDYPEEVIACVNCTPAGQTPVRATIFDVDMVVRTQKLGDGENAQTAIIVDATSNPQPLNPKFQELLKYAPKLDQRFAPSSLEFQASIWKINAAPGQQQGQQPQGQQAPAFRGYGATAR